MTLCETVWFCVELSGFVWNNVTLLKIVKLETMRCQPDVSYSTQRQFVRLPIMG